jgi:hypothetical protein
MPLATSLTGTGLPNGFFAAMGAPFRAVYPTRNRAPRENQFHASIDDLGVICYEWHMTRSAILIQNRRLQLRDGTIIQIKIWKLPTGTDERPHGLKYSLFYGRPGERIVGYDNERGKGDHRHYRDREERYAFTSMERLIADFWADVRKEIGNG